MFSSKFMQSIVEVAQNRSIASDNMMQAIDLWLEMYGGNAPWLSEDNSQSLGLPAIIATETARAVTVEMKVEISGSPMADFINEQFEPIRKSIRTNTEYACAGGGLVFKPFVSGDKIITEIAQANSFYPIAYDNSQKITGACFVYRKWIGKKIYCRLEKHMLEGESYTIENTCYVSAVEDALGKECELSEVEEWAEIQPIVKLDGVKAPLFAYFKIPVGNTIDMRSPLGTSVYARAVGLIQDADTQYQSLMWEYRGGELAIESAEDNFKMVNGIPQLPQGKERLYRLNNMDPVAAGGNNLMIPWSPSLRDSNYIEGLNQILRHIEDVCCISRGTISDPNIQAKTATEIINTKQRTYTHVSDIQKALEGALNDLAYAMYCIASLYELCPDGEYEVAYSWDDSIINDATVERERDRQDVRDGLMMNWEYRMKWYGETEAQAKGIFTQLEEEELTDDELMGFNNEPKGKEDDTDE